MARAATSAGSAMFATDDARPTANSSPIATADSCDSATQPTCIRSAV